MFARSFRGSIILLLLFGGLLMLLVSKAFPKSRNSLDKLIQNKLIRAGVDPHTARIWAAVSRHESDTYTSELAESANNIFGMNFPIERQTTAIGKYKIGKYVYAAFPSKADSIDDLLLYMSAKRYPASFNSVRDLVTFMKSKGYFEDTLENYIRAVEFHFNKIL